METVDMAMLTALIGLITKAGVDVRAQRKNGNGNGPLGKLETKVDALAKTVDSGLKAVTVELKEARDSREKLFDKYETTLEKIAHVEGRLDGR